MMYMDSQWPRCLGIEDVGVFPSQPLIGVILALATVVPRLFRCRLSCALLSQGLALHRLNHPLTGLMGALFGRCGFKPDHPVRDPD
jgi:hypothetical protein